MMGTQRRLIVVLEPTRLSVSVVLAKTIARTSWEHLSTADWAAHWESGLRSLDEALGRLIAKVGGEPGQRAVVVFDNASVIAELHEVGASGADAVGAARLAIAERMKVSPSSPCIAVRSIAEFTDAERGRRSQMLVVGADEQVVQGVQHWIERAGLRFVGGLPIGGVLLSRLADEVVGDRGEGERRVFVMDRHRTAAAFVQDGRLSVLRSFEVGVGHVVESLVKASAGGDGTRGVLTADKAMVILERVGIPSSNAKASDYEDLDPRAVLPMLQPVVQRLVVELKQSFRIASRQSVGGRAAIELMGLGCCVQGLSDVIADALNVDVQAKEGASSPVGIEALVADGAGLELCIVSSMHRAAREDARVRQSALVGSVLGLGLLAMQAGWFAVQSRQVRLEMERGASGVVEIQEFHKASDAARELRSKVVVARDIVEREGGGQAHLEASLREVALASRDRVELIEIRGSQEGGQSLLTIAGVSSLLEGDSKLNEFVSVLGESPLIEGVEVTSRRLVESDGVQAHQFRLRVRLLSLPVVVAQEDVE